MTSLLPDLINAFQHANDVGALAERFDFDLPAEHARAVAVTTATRQILDEPQPHLPATLPAPSKVAAVISKHAADLDRWRSRAVVAQEMHDRANRDAARIALEQAPRLVAHVAERGRAILDRLTELLDQAPHTLTGHESAEQIATHTELLRLAGEASSVVMARGQLATATGEGADIGTAAAFLVIDPADTAIVREVDQVVAAVAANGFPSDVASWATLRPFRLSLAGHTEAAQRVAAYYEARSHLINTIDGGMRDHSIAELATLGDNPNAAGARSLRIA